MFLEKAVLYTIQKRTQTQDENRVPSTGEAHTHNDMELATISDGKNMVNGHTDQHACQSKADTRIDATANSNHGPRHTLIGITQSLITLLALSTCSLFEGVTLGLQETTKGVWNMTIAVLSHEIVVAFSLGLQLVRHNSSLRVLVYAVIYGLITPAGVAIGWAISETSSGFDITSSVLMALVSSIQSFLL